MKIKKQQHIIPKTYMKAFVDISQLIIENQPFTPFVWLIDKSFEIEPNKKSPQKSLRKNKFYNLDNDKDYAPVIEDALSIIEGKYTDVLKKLSAKQSLFQQDVVDLFVFIETLYKRTEINIDHWQNLINNLEKNYRMVDQARNNSQNFSDEYFKGSHEIAKKQIIAGLGAMGKLLFESGFLLVFNESEMDFFSSDNPVAWIQIHIDDLQRWNLANEWLHENIKNNHKKFFCYCPLTPKLALIASPFIKILNNEVYQYVKFKNHQFTFSMNLLTHGNANSTIISNTDNPYGNHREKVIGLLKQLRNINPPIGKEICFYTDQSRYKIDIENYEIDGTNPSRCKIKFWTKNHFTLRNLTKDNIIESIQIYEDGKEMAGARNLKFDFVGLFDDEASILLQHYSR